MRRERARATAAPATATDSRIDQPRDAHGAGRAAAGARRVDAGQAAARRRCPSGSSRKCWSTSGSTTSTCSSARARSRQYLTEYERDAIRPHVLGNFRDAARRHRAQPGDALLSRQLAERAAEHRTADARPRSTASRRGAPVAAAASGRGLNENYARELMELHTLGVDGGYTQQDVIEVARILHGLDDRSAAAGRRVRVPAADARHGRRRRSSGTTFTGRRRTRKASARSTCSHAIPPRRATSRSSSRSASWPTSRRRRWSTRGAKRSSRPKAICARSCASIVTSPEFFAPTTYRAKVKTPLEFVVSARARDRRAT